MSALLIFGIAWLSAVSTMGGNGEFTKVPKPSTHYEVIQTRTAGHRYCLGDVRP